MNATINNSVEEVVLVCISELSSSYHIFSQICGRREDQRKASVAGNLDHTFYLPDVTDREFGLDGFSLV